MRPVGLSRSADVPRCPVTASSQRRQTQRASAIHASRQPSFRHSRTNTVRSPRCGLQSSKVHLQQSGLVSANIPVVSRISVRSKALAAPIAAEEEATESPTTSISVTSLHSSAQFQDVIEHNPGRLVVLMCKAQGCRPCKMFSRKFQRMSEQYQDAIFLDIMGDETKDTRKLMINLDVRATPTFFLYRDGRLGQTLTGINENNLRNAITDFALPEEKDNAPLE